MELKQIWAYRDLLVFLVWRDIIARYKQSLLGVIWIVLDPLIMALVFTLVFGFFAKLPADGMPFPVFYLSGLVCYGLFQSGTTGAMNALAGSGVLLEKVYFPRLILPFSALLNSLIDCFFGIVVLFMLMCAYGVSPCKQAFLAPLFVLVALLSGASAGIWAAALHIEYRDVGRALAALLRIGMFVSPVIYSANAVTRKELRVLYFLNPMAVAIDGFRWSVFGVGPGPQPTHAIAVCGVLVLLVLGLLFFRHREAVFADVV